MAANPAQAASDTRSSRIVRSPLSATISAGALVLLHRTLGMIDAFDRPRPLDTAYTQPGIDVKGDMIPKRSTHYFSRTGPQPIGTRKAVKALRLRRRC